MAVPSTNVGLTDIQTEFGGSNPISLSEYYSGGPFVSPATPAPNGPIPSSGQISIGQFRGASAVVEVDYLIVAGGGGGAGHASSSSFGCGGGGAGGYRASGFGPAPLQGSSIFSGKGTHNIVVGAGGDGRDTPDGPIPGSGFSGSDSSFAAPQPFGITSAGGGGGSVGNNTPGVPGGSGGGDSAHSSGPDNTGGTGNTPPVSPPQGNNGGNTGAFPNRGSAGGGGAGAQGTDNPSGNDGSPGGAGVPNAISGSAVDYAGGGGGGGWDNAPAGTGGIGGGGNGGRYSDGFSGTVNTGGGGGGCGPINVVGGGAAHAGGNGGSGIVIIRSPSGAPMSVTPGTNTVAPDGAATVATFTVTGTLTFN